MNITTFLSTRSANQQTGDNRAESVSRSGGVANSRAVRGSSKSTNESTDFSLLLSLLSERTDKLGELDSKGKNNTEIDHNSIVSRQFDAEEEVRKILSSITSGSTDKGSAFSSNSYRISLADLVVRASNSGRAELLARNDVVAADVKRKIDSLLDIIGSPQAQALALSISTPVDNAIRDPELLAPAFRTRLNRVIERMRDEYGHDVQIIETLRSPERQEHLFAQGRMEPGPIVTWTTNSAHLKGEAADVMVDGKWDNPRGYERLQQIAKEEGLHTLGMRDPGHLELRGSSAEGVLAYENTNQRVTSNTVAATAAVASVASVASVAQVAQVARPGSSINTDGMASTVPTTYTAQTGVSESGQQTSNFSNNSNGNNSSGNNSSLGNSHSSNSPLRPEKSSVAPEAIGPLNIGSYETVTSTDIVRPSSESTASTSAVRAENIAVLKEDAPAREISSLSMQIETPDGPEHVRVSLKGSSVDAKITTSNPDLADRIRMQTADLQDSLGRHGLDTERLKVQQSSRSSDSDAARASLSDRSELLRTASVGNSQHANPENSSQRERGARNHAEHQRDAHQDEDSRNNPHGRQRNRQEQ